MRVRGAVVATAWVAVLSPVAVLLPGPSMAGADDEPPPDAPPVIVSTALTPASPAQLTWQGGTVHVTADVTDDIRVQDVALLVYEGSRMQAEYDLTTGGADVPIVRDTAPTGHTFTLYVRARDGFQDSSGTPREVFATAGTVEQTGRTSNEAPTLSDVTATPRTLPTKGGTVTVEALATDDLGAGPVVATATPASGPAVTTELSSVGDDHYRGTLQLPANTDAATRRYTIGLTASDSEGATTTADAGTVEVGAAPLAAPRTVSFGEVKLGTVGLYGFVLRNTAARGTAPVVGTLTVTGTDYAFAGTKAKTVRYRVAGRATSLVGLTLRPSVTGLRNGTVVITRKDATATQTVTLTGRGV